MESSKTTIAFPPGETLKEIIDDRGMTQKELAQRMGMTEKFISQLITGRASLTYDTAIMLEAVLGTPASFWTNLETIYRKKLHRIEDEKAYEHEMQIAKSIPFQEIAKLGWVNACETISGKVEELRRFFEVARLDCINDLEMFQVAYRVMGENDSSKYARAAWLQKAALVSVHQNVNAIDLERLKASIVQIREMSIEPPEKFVGELTSLLAECGISFVLLPHIKGTFVQGATFYVPKKYVLCLSARGKYADRFWFSLMHEIGHILLGHFSNEASADDNDLAADIFAREALIPENDYKRFVDASSFSIDSIRCFANRIKVHSGIVVGRLQHDGYISHTERNCLREQYSIE